MSIAKSDIRPELGDTLINNVRARLASVSPRFLVVGGATLIVAYLTIVPLGYLLNDTFSDTGGFSLGGFARAYGAHSGAGQMLVNSVIYAGGSAALALALGASLAWVQVRTDAPLKSLFFAASLGPLVIPSVLYTAAWIFLADPRIGLFNADIFKPLFGAAPINIFSVWGMVWVQGLHHAPIAFLLMVSAFRSMDPSLEESAEMSGARRITVLRRITLPLLRPALVAGALLVFVQSMESFEVPALLGLHNNIYVFTSRIYFELRTMPIDYGAAGAYAVVLLAIGALGVLGSAWITRSSRGLQTVGGKAFRPRPIRLGRARPWVGAGIIVFFVVALVAPLAILLYASLQPYYTAPTGAALHRMSLANYHELVHLPLAFTSLKNSIILGAGSATAVMFLAATCAWVIVRTRAAGRRLLDVLSFTPIVIPGLVLGLALSFVYLRVATVIYGTLWILLISYVTRYLPYGMRYASSALIQVGNELEESALVFGASWWQTFRRILVPLASGGLVAGWIYIFIVSFRELSATILLYSPGREVLSVLIFNEFQDGKLTLLAAIGIVMVALLMVIVTIAYRLGAKVGLQSED